MARKNPFPMTREARQMWKLAKTSQEASSAYWAFDKAHGITGGTKPNGSRGRCRVHYNGGPGESWGRWRFGSNAP